MAPTPGQSRSLATRTHRALPSLYFWWSVSRPARLLRKLFSAFSWPR
ncbi:MAG TPA: hypothetical protein VFZ53_31535 [Polyangiaceae bacterium]